MLSGPLQTLHIGFGGQRVAVQSHFARALAQVEEGFRQMVTPEGEGVAPARVFELNRHRMRYTVLADGEAVLEGVSFRKAYHELRHRVVRGLMDARPDLVWFHAGAAVPEEGRAVLLAAASGKGKSTLTVRLCQSGWRYLSDDILPTDPGTDRVHPFPLTPNVRAQVGVKLTPDQVIDLRREAVHFPSEAVCRDAAPVGAIVFPSYQFGATAHLERCPPALASVKLLERCLNVEVQRGAAVQCATRLVQRVPAFRLTFSDVPPALDLLRKVTDASPPVPPSAA